MMNPELLGMDPALLRLDPALLRMDIELLRSEQFDAQCYEILRHYQKIHHDFRDGVDCKYCEDKFFQVKWCLEKHLTRGGMDGKDGIITKIHFARFFTPKRRPCSLVANDYFVDFCHMMCPGIKLSDTESLSFTVLDEMHIQELLRLLYNKNVCLAVSKWTAPNEYLLRIILNNGSAVFIMVVITHEYNSHLTYERQIYVERLMCFLGEAFNCKIYSSIFDGPNVLVNDNYLTHICSTYYLKTVAEYLGKYVQRYRDNIVEIINYFRTNERARLLYNRATKKPIVDDEYTSWHISGHAFGTYMDNYQTIVKLCERYKFLKIRINVIQAMSRKDEDERLTRIFRPIAQSFDQLQYVCGYAKCTDIWKTLDNMITKDLSEIQYRKFVCIYSRAIPSSYMLAYMLSPVMRQKYENTENITRREYQYAYRYLRKHFSTGFPFRTVNWYYNLEKTLRNQLPLGSDILWWNKFIKLCPNRISTSDFLMIRKLFTASGTCPLPKETCEKELKMELLHDVLS